MTLSLLIIRYSVSPRAITGQVLVSHDLSLWRELYTSRIQNIVVSGEGVCE